ncbi:MAG: hypothetical protein NXI07_00360 [bacterium]|nr:hypothetical protein [bacterium]
MRYRVLLFSICSVFTICTCHAIAQDADTPDPQADAQQAQEAVAPPEPQLFEFETAGFDFSLEVPFEPVIRESTNASIYAVTVQRRASDGLAWGTDGKMAFVRLTQTIDSVDATGTVEQLLGATVSDAFRAIQNAYGEVTQEVTTDCSLEILGEERRGKRIDIGLLPSGTLAYVECYALELDDGTGVGITLKIHDPVGDEIPNDLIIADDLLLNLSVNPLEPETPYFYSLGGYPIYIPVRSSIREAQKINKFVTGATIAYEYGSLRLQVIEIPPEVNAQRAADFQIESFDQALTDQENRGEIQVLWSGDVAIPAGQDGNTILSGRAYEVRMGSQEFVSTMHAAIDDGRIVVANFSGTLEHAEAFTGYASSFFDRPLASAAKPRGTDSAYGYDVLMPHGLRTLVAPESSAGSVLAFSTDDEHAWSDLISSVTDRRAGFTRVDLALDKDQTLAMSQEALLRDMFDEEPGEVVQRGTLDLGGEDSLEYQTTAVSSEVHVKSYMANIDGAGVLISTIAHPKSLEGHDLVTRSLIGRISRSEHPGSIELPFGTLSYPADKALLTRSNPRGVRDSFEVRFDDGSLKILVHPLSPEATDDPFIRHLQPAWAAYAGEDAGLEFPATSGDELEQVEFAGSAARMVELRSGAAAYTRLTGFIHENTFITVIAAGRDETHADRLMSMIETE